MSFGFYAVSLGILLLNPAEAFTDPYGLTLWLFVLPVISSVIAGNVRSIALSTLVTILIPEDRRDKANGLVGMVTGIGFLTTSMISGVLVAWGGMLATLLLALAATALVFLHLLTVKLDEGRADPPADMPAEPKRVDLAGTIKVIAGVPGLFALILFACFNNFLGGVFMALLDAYGLSLVSVEIWGILFGVSPPPSSFRASSSPGPGSARIRCAPFCWSTSSPGRSAASSPSSIPSGCSPEACSCGCCSAPMPRPPSTPRSRGRAA